MRGLRVGVIGGGLGGLAAALALRAGGHEVVVFEQAEVFRPVGAGISLWPNGVKVMALLGLVDRLVEVAGRMERMAYADRHGRTLTEVTLDPLYRTVGQRAWPLARADLQDILVEAVGASSIRFGRRCLSVHSDEEGAAATFDDGEVFEADLIVAADGTHSRARTWVAGADVERSYVGYVNFNAIVAPPTERWDPGTWTTWVGDGQRASVMPCGRGRLYAFFDIPMALDRATDPDLGPLDELRRGFGGWSGPVAALLEALSDTSLNRVLIHEVPPMLPWSRGRVALLGDAAHGMAPDLGQGGCQALEDAWVLNHFVTTTDLSVGDALRRYETERAARTAEIVRRARKRSDLTHAVDPAATEAWYRSLEGDSGEAIIAGLVESVVTGPCR